MAAKVRVDSRAPYLLPLLLGASWRPNAPLLLMAHLGNIYLHASRASFILDHELWDMLTEFAVIAAILAQCIEKLIVPSSAVGGAPPTNRIIARSAPAVRSMMVIFYAAAGFWKLNSSFFDPIASCAPLFLMRHARRCIRPRSPRTGCIH